MPVFPDGIGLAPDTRDAGYFYSSLRLLLLLALPDILFVAGIPPTRDEGFLLF